MHTKRRTYRLKLKVNWKHFKDQQFGCEADGLPFTKHNELQVLQRRYENSR